MTASRGGFVGLALWLRGRCLPVPPSRVVQPRRGLGVRIAALVLVSRHQLLAIRRTCSPSACSGRRPTSMRPRRPRVAARSGSTLFTTMLQHADHVHHRLRLGCVLVVCRSGSRRTTTTSRCGSTSGWSALFCGSYLLFSAHRARAPRQPGRRAAATPAASSRFVHRRHRGVRRRVLRRAARTLDVLLDVRRHRHAPGRCVSSRRPCRWRAPERRPLRQRSIGARSTMAGRRRQSALMSARRICIVGLDSLWAAVGRGRPQVHRRRDRAARVAGARLARPRPRRFDHRVRRWPGRDVACVDGITTIAAHRRHGGTPGPEVLSSARVEPVCRADGGRRRCVLPVARWRVHRHHRRGFAA